LWRRGGAGEQPPPPWVETREDRREMTSFSAEIVLSVMLRKALTTRTIISTFRRRSLAKSLLSISAVVAPPRRPRTFCTSCARSRCSVQQASNQQQQFGLQFGMEGI
jgi:hypothetical protein